MSRHRWYQVHWPMRIRELATKLEAHAFREEMSDGFIVDKVRDSRIEGRFVERIELSDQTTNPFGERFSFDRVEFRQINFRITASTPGLEVAGTTAGSPRLANKLAEICNYRLAVSDLHVSVFEWLALFQDLSRSVGYVDIIQIGQIKLGGTISARAIIKGKEDVHAATQNLTKGQEFVVEKIQFRPSAPNRGSVVFSHLGSIIVRSKEDIEVVNHVRRALETMESAKKAGKAAD
ncbi:hypothetical protein [Xanthobacter versatilis]|uniref:hypothetical protein n=1 Tax=Xanthobacter autotrophicus (strain ATCC BAA-1158 / Py2) TaxID=78245 RepID=UPI00372BC487